MLGEKQRDAVPLDFSVMERKGKMLRKSHTLSDRDRFRDKSLWVAIDADKASESDSRLQTGYSIALPAHALESQQRASGGIGVFITQQGPAVVRDLVARPGAEVQESISPNDNKKRGTEVQGRDDVGFMTSHPFKAAANTQPRAGQHVERIGLFMRSSNKYAPNGQLSKKLGSQRKGISVKSLSVLNNTV